MCVGNGGSGGWFGCLVVVGMLGWMYVGFDSSIVRGCSWCGVSGGGNG